MKRLSILTFSALVLLSTGAFPQQGEHSGGRIGELNSKKSHIQFDDPCVSLQGVEDRRRGCTRYCNVPGRYQKMRASNGSLVNCPVSVAYRCSDPLPVSCRAKGGR